MLDSRNSAAGARSVALGALIGVMLASQAGAVEIIRVNSVTPNDPKNNDTMKILDLAQRVKEKSNGELELQIHYSSSLMPQSQQFEGVTQGVIDAYFDSPNHSAGFIPEADLFSLPLNFTDHADLVAKTSGCIDGILDVQYGTKGAKYLGSFPGSAIAVIMASGNVTKLDELVGKKIRVFGPAQADLMTDLGASPVYVPFAELEVALSRGVADGYLTGWANVSSYPGLKAESKSIIWPPLQGSLATTVVMNKAKFDALSPELQKALTDAVYESALDVVEQLKVGEEAAREDLKQSNIPIIELPADDQAKLFASGEKVWGVWADKVVAAGGDEGRARADKIIAALKNGCGG